MNEFQLFCAFPHPQDIDGNLFYSSVASDYSEIVTFYKP